MKPQGMESKTFTTIKAAIRLENLYRERASLSWQIEKGVITVPPIRDSSGVRFSRTRPVNDEDRAKLAALDAKIANYEKRARDNIDRRDLERVKKRVRDGRPS